ncbi:unnamed protein product (macronuclear) [Paramecium tetraurelia]|uniref:Chromo domain-containing protein n=1 Tax=Paramecium tetraurelia TaxID=5888 RepID=A0CWH9_PARTE|nr:uncharacterized protein GSPATT00001349001 [Paramecium tetraurelia]CAK75146.1 unnamed protein product [Paramecium tetraurelia]|eukprot:XP_001442543.1 hypothetical protein (macronuclear) [Paramecium tetraurelia strain d4-2]
MNIKHPVELLKKKIDPEAIMYKFRWSNNSVSIEPMTQLTPEMLVLVHDYELKQLGHDPQEPKPQKHIKQDTQPITQFANGKKPEEQKREKKSNEKVDKAEKVVEKPQEKQKQQLSQKDLDNALNNNIGNGPHKPRKSKPCQVKQVRHDNGRVDFLVCFEDSADQKWISLDEMKEKAPVAVCEFLLGKVKYGGTMNKK